MQAVDTTGVNHQGQDPITDDEYYEDEDDYEEDPIEVANYHKELGNDMFRNLDLDGAIEEYTKAIEILPTSPVCFANRAAVYISKKEYRRALEDALESIRLDPGYSKAYYRAIRAQIKLGLLSDARLSCYSVSEKVRQEKQFSLLLTQLTELEEQLRLADSLLTSCSFAEAQDVINSLSNEMESSTALGILKARLLIGLEKFSAGQSILSALYHRPENEHNMELLTWRGIAMYYNGQDDLARRHFSEILRTDPDNKIAMRYFKVIRKFEQEKNAANEAFKQNHVDEAIRLYTSCLQVDPKNQNYKATILGNRAAAYLKQKNYEAAVVDCQKSLSIRPENVKLLVRKARCYMSLAKLKEAVADFTAAYKAGAEDIEEELEAAKGLLRRANQISLYTDLGLPVTASIDEIKRAYKKLALKYHPDRNQGSLESEHKFKKITAAYNILSDPVKKQKYDRGYEIEDLA